MALKVPTHSVDGVPTFIPRQDPAWDEDRIKREGDGEDHPVNRYHRGETRFDLEAPLKFRGAACKVTDWLTGEATKFRLRRLTVEERAAYGDVCRTGPEQALVLAARFGVEDCPTGEVEIRRRGDGTLSDDCLEDIANLGGMGMVGDLGLAVIRLSRDPTAAEKKL